MQVAKWGNSLAVRLPLRWSRRSTEVRRQHRHPRQGRTFLCDEKAPGARDLLARIRKYRGRLPSDFKFDRAQANERREDFFDTNVVLYLLSADTAKADRAEELLARGGTISVQVLNEFVAVASRKLRMSWIEMRESAGRDPSRLHRSSR